MIISANVRPRNVKRGVSTKQLCKALGFEDQVGLNQMVGCIEFSAEEPKEFAFLAALYQAFHPMKDAPSKISIELDGKLAMTYSNNQAKPHFRQRDDLR